jgi:hypothetical protein
MLQPHQNDSPVAEQQSDQCPIVQAGDKHNYRLGRLRIEENEYRACPG